MSSISSSRHSSRISSTATEGRFHGVLAVSKNHVIRRQNYNFFSYLFLLSPPNAYFLFFIQIWRYLQWLIPCFVTGSKILYPTDSSSEIYMGILSIFSRIVPSFVNYNYYVITAPIYIVLFILFFLLFFISLYLFYLKSMIPKQLSFTLVYFFESVWVLFQPIILAMTGDQLGKVFIQDSNIKNPGVWTSLILVLIIYVFVALAHEAYVSLSLSFRPSSMPVFNHMLEIIILNLTSAVSFTTGILPYCPYEARIALYVISILIYGSCFAFIPLGGGFLKSIHCAMFYAISSTAIAILILNLIFDILNREVHPIALLAEYIIFVISIILAIMFQKARSLKIQDTLDKIADQPDTFDDLVSNVFAALLYASEGFSSSHPLITSMKFMRMTTERWPFASTTWMLYARFVSCFPEENRLLLWIDDQIQKNVYHTESIHYFRAQIHYIIQRREASMTSQLKQKIAECNKLTATCRNRMRAYWESVMQGNTFDMEATALAAQNSIENAEATIQHFLKMYPNNQYVTHSYLRFLTGVKSDPIEIKKWTHNYNILKNGQTITPDICQQQGIVYFPNLLSLAVAKQSSGYQQVLISDMIASQGSVMPNTSPSTARSDINKEDQDEGESLLTSIRLSIYDLSVPAIKTAAIVLTIYFLLIFGVGFPIGLSFIHDNFIKHNDFMNIISKASSVRNSLVMLCFFCIEHITQIFGIEPTLSFILEDHDDTTPMFNTSSIIRDLIISLEESENSLRTLNTLQNEGLHIRKAYQIYFENINNYTYYTIIDYPNFSYSYTSLSVESTSISTKLFASSLIALTSNSEIQNFLHDEKMSTMIAQIDESTNYLTTLCIEVNAQIYENCDNLKYNLMIVGICLAVGFFLIYIITIIVLAYKINSNKRATSKCFVMIPKHIISSIVDTFKRSTTATLTDTMSETGAESHKNRKEENFLATLSSAVTSQWTVYGSVILLSIFQALVMICAILGAIFLYFSTNDMCDFCERYSPFHNYLLLSFTKAVLSASSLYLTIISDYHYPLPGFTREEILAMGDTNVEQMKQYYNLILFGNASMGVENIGSLKPEFIVSGFTGTEYAHFDGFPSFHDVYTAMAPSSQFYLANMIIKRSLAMAHFEVLNFTDEQIGNIWHLLYAHFYEQYMRPLSEQLPNSTIEDYNVILNQTIIIYSVLYIFAILFFLLSILKLIGINSNIKWIISTMLQCPPEALTSSESVMRILSGSFTEDIYKVPIFSEQLYEKVTNDSDDAFFITTPDTTIIHATKATEEMFGIKPEKLTGKSFRELLVRSSNDVYGNGEMSLHDQSIDDFLNKLDTAISGRSSLSFTHMLKIELHPIEFNDDPNISQNPPSQEEEKKEIKYINITLTAFSKFGVVKSLIKARGKLSQLSFTCQDVTDLVTTEMQLKEEKKKSDRMLKTLLPPIVVNSMYDTEGGVSTHAQSASVIAIGIHDFDLTVASISASQAITTLTRVYSEFDSLITPYSTMIKVKTVSDLYIAVGGIFSSGNSPEAHAKECLNFGIDCAKKISEITKELGLPLKLKIGMNTGGPVFSGLLMIDRPTYNIVGTPVDVALSLMVASEPMIITISRYVYELVYGANYKIKEGKEIELKSGNVLTYLVDPF